MTDQLFTGPHSTCESECRWQTIRAQQAIDEAKALRRDYGLLQIDRNNLRNLLDATEAKVDELHGKLEAVEAEAKALHEQNLILRTNAHADAECIGNLQQRVAKLEAALRVIESHRRKCHEYDADVGDELRDFDEEDVRLMEWQARAALQEGSA